MNSKQMSIKVIIQGRVQGVGFRATILKHAQNLGVLGSVRNASDGSVEIVATGSNEILEKFISSIKENPGLASIESFLKEDVETNAEQFKTFKIIY